MGSSFFSCGLARTGNPTRITRIKPRELSPPGELLEPIRAISLFSLSLTGPLQATYFRLQKGWNDPIAQPAPASAKYSSNSLWIMESSSSNSICAPPSLRLV